MPPQRGRGRGGRRRGDESEGEETDDSLSTIDSEEEREKEVKREQWEKFKMANSNPHARSWELADLVDLVIMGAGERRKELGCNALTIGVVDQHGVPQYLRKMLEVGYTKRIQKERPTPTITEKCLTLNPCIGAAHFACFSRDVPFGTIPVKYTDRDPLQQIGVYLAFRALLLLTALVALVCYVPIRIGAAILDFDSKEVRLSVKVPPPPDPHGTSHGRVSRR